MDFSIVIPVYNAEPYLVRCIRALESQDYPRDRYEIIMIDNNSTDGSYSIIRQYPSIKLLKETKQGSYAARNRGLAEASGAVIAFTDPDCVPTSNWLQSIADNISNPGVGIVIGLTFSGVDSIPLTIYMTYEHHIKKYIFNSRIPELYFGQTGNMAVRREFLDKDKPFMERHRGADTIFVRQAVDKHSCDIMQYCPKMIVRHLEIDSVVKMYRKMFILGRSRSLYKRITYVRTLTINEHLSTLYQAIRSKDLTISQGIMLLTMLAGFRVFRKIGSLSATNIKAN
jgi:glycosyltransferase involved in cell wall biosynthesis